MLRSVATAALDYFHQSYNQASFRSYQIDLLLLERNFLPLVMFFSSSFYSSLLARFVTFLLFSLVLIMPFNVPAVSWAPPIQIHTPFANPEYLLISLKSFRFCMTVKINWSFQWHITHVFVIQFLVWQGPSFVYLHSNIQVDIFGQVHKSKFFWIIEFWTQVLQKAIRDLNYKKRTWRRIRIIAMTPKQISMHYRQLQLDKVNELAEWCFESRRTSQLGLKQWQESYCSLKGTTGRKGREAMTWIVQEVTNE